MAVFQRRRRIRPVADDAEQTISPVPWIGMVLIVSSFFLYAASGVIAPGWAVVVLVAVWLTMFVLCCAWWSAHPKRLVVVGAVSYPLWFCLVVGGAVAFGWQP